MTSSVQTSTRPVTVEITKDRMEVWIRLGDSGGSPPPDGAMILAALADAKVPVTDDVRSRVDALLQQSERPNRVLMVNGRPVVEGRNGEFVWDERFEKEIRDWQGDSAVNYYTLSSIVTVEAGETIGTIQPPVPGHDGIDVFGTVLRPTVESRPVELDGTVRLAEDGSSTVVAAVAGKVICEHGRLRIDEALTVKGDVNFEVGNIESSVDVYIEGTVQDLFTVKSKRSISVRGAIEAATVTADRDVTVRGGILGRGKGSVTAGGQIVAKFSDDVSLRATGDVTIAKELMNTRVHADAKLLAVRGTIIGGEVYAREGVEVATLGSDAYVPTRVVVGMHPDAVAQLHRLDEFLADKRKVRDHIEHTVRPWLRDQRMLTPQQHEEMIAALDQADSIEDDVKQAERGRRELLQRAAALGVPYVLVANIVWPNVTLRIEDRQTVFRKELKGPLRIEKRKMAGVTGIVAVNQSDGAVALLPSISVVDEASTKAAGPLAEQSGNPDGSGG